jgi:hypothetical protein
MHPTAPETRRPPKSRHSDRYSLIISSSRMRSSAISYHWMMKHKVVSSGLKCGVLGERKLSDRECSQKGLAIPGPSCGSGCARSIAGYCMTTYFTALNVAAAHDSRALPAPFWQTVRYTPGSVPARTGHRPRMAVCTYREQEIDMFHLSWSAMSACSWETRSIRTSTRNMHCMPLKVEEFSFCVLGVHYVLTLDLSSSWASSPVPSGSPLEPPILLPPFLRGSNYEVVPLVLFSVWIREIRFQAT